MRETLDAGGDADVSEDGVYRYRLSRWWRPATNGRQWLTFVMLNPSTADAEVDDPTIRRCVGFARREGLNGIVVVNLYAARATNPDALRVLDEPVGPSNDHYLSWVLGSCAAQRAPVVAAWGAHKGIDERAAAVCSLVPDVDWRCLGRTKTGAPRHPLYVRGDQPLEPFEPST